MTASKPEVQSSKTDPLWVFENYGAAAELIDELEAARAADKARIAELEKERDEWHRLFDSAGQLSKNACDDLNSAKSRIAELVLSLRTVVGMLHHRATTPLERQAIRIAETALAQQGKEGE
jgi:alkylated DNA nucleotide flippase Atl1|tara:strand:- start:43 stop:405 length:363 start_codon:yes stop_codon:yes gene_type:complete